MKLVPTAADAVSAWRGLRRSPWYTATAVAVMAVAISLVATVLAITDGALFKPLPFADEARLLALAPGHARLAALSGGGPAAPRDVVAWRDGVPDVAMSAMSVGDVATIGPKKSVRSARVDEQFFDVVGRQPAIGGFAPSDFAPLQAVRPAIITHALWLREFGGDRAVIGRVFTGDEGRGVRIVGVMPADFVFPDQFLPEAICPLFMPDPTSRGRFLRVLARLPSSESTARLEARLTAAAARLAATDPPPPPDLPERTRIYRGTYDVVRVMPIREAMNAGRERMAWTVLGVAAALFALTGLNLAALGLARARERRREFALRISLGAPPATLFRLFLVEQTITIFAGSIIGLWLASMALRTTLDLMPRYLLMTDATIGWRVAAAITVIAALCAIGSSAFATRASLRAGVRPDLADGGTSTHRTSPWLISAQVALALVLTITGALVAGSLLRVWNTDPGVAMDRRAVLAFGGPSQASGADMTALLDTIRGVAGVQHAGATDRPYVERALNGSVFEAPASAAGSSDPESMAVTPGFLDAAGVTLLAGRLASADELDRGDPVIVVSRAVADAYWPGQSPLGLALTHGDGRAFRVVGVVADARLVALDRASRGEIYWPMAARANGPYFHSTVVAFSSMDARAVARVTETLQARCPDCHISRAEPLVVAFANTIRARRFNAWLFASFSLAALAIAAVGVLGLVAMATARRTREMGIRLALGSTRSRLVQTVVLEQARAVIMGVLAGAAGAAWAAGFVEAYLYETAAFDPLIWIGSIATMVVVAAAATFVPSWLVSRTDPVRSLRPE